MRPAFPLPTTNRHGHSAAPLAPSAPPGLVAQAGILAVAPPVAKVARRARTARSLGELSEAILSGGCTRIENLGSLHAALQSFGEQRFFAEILPFACDEALRFQQLFPSPIAVIDGAPQRQVQWTQRQCLCILCNAFLCSWPGRTSRGGIMCAEEHELPSINYDELMSSRGHKGVHSAKCEMFLHYLAKQRARLAAGELLSRPLLFRRCAAERPEWLASEKALCQVTVRPLGESIDDAIDMLRADFANQTIGGGLSFGNVQEEIMFACHPELNSSRLVFTTMRPNEAIVLIGAERFATHTGYGDSLGCGGAYNDPAPLVRGYLQSYCTAIDALDYSKLGVREQFSSEHMERELLKAYAGFWGPAELGLPKQLATGNWGCGAFQGDPANKFLLQWIAASEAGLDMHYFPFSDKNLERDLPKVVELLLSQDVTVGGLCEWLLGESAQRPSNVPVLAQLEEAFEREASDDEEEGCHCAIS